ncbi:MAG: glycosyltransferase family 39 protein [Acidobacteria bacterium]|nr:glycosyltransferase family 39 protein [Acidobacteriota bacterium]
MQARLAIGRTVAFEQPAAVRHPFHDRALLFVAAAALLAGVGGAIHYARLGLTLSHYDARAHLVVARRILDNLTPCWEQIGAVWLPLPHILNALPVQVDAFYRSGASAIAISISAFAVTAGAVFLLARQLTDSRQGAYAAAALLVLNPNLLYLQATPMTEPLLMALSSAAAALLIEAVRHPRGRTGLGAGICLAAACLTRYEAWPIAAASIALAAFALARRGETARSVLRDMLPVVTLPAAAIAAFLVHSKLSTDSWFVTGGFYVPDNKATGNAGLAAVAVWWGTHVMTGYAVLTAAAIGATRTLVRSFAKPRDRGADAIALALAAAALLPMYAFYQGHPFRIRYMAPLIPVVALFAAVPVSTLRKGRQWAIGALLLIAVYENPPFSSQAAMVQEAQWDLPASRGRQAVSDRLAREYDDTLIMASMGSLGHYMQELSRVLKPRSRSGFDVADFLHEGNGDIWMAALDDPAPHVGWVLIEEQSEGGDLLAALARTRPAFLRGFVRVAEGGGVSLYRKAINRGARRVTQSQLNVFHGGFSLQSPRALRFAF